MTHRGRPRDVLMYIDYCENPNTPCIVDFGAGRTEALRALPRAIAAYRAAYVRERDAQHDVETWRQLIATMERIR